jgi:dienelactone hydrolase
MPSMVKPAHALLALLFLTIPTTPSCSMLDREKTPDVVGEEVTYTAADGTTCKGYLAYDRNLEGERPGVLVVHEWWGHNEYTRRRARMLAELGYTAFALDMYGDGKKTEHPDEAGKFMNAVLENMDAGMKRFAAAREVLEGHETTNPEKIAAIGYCFGGGVVLQMARSGSDLDGVASFHGSLGAQERTSPEKVKAQVLVCHGGADEFVPAEAVAATRKEFGDKLEFHEYPGAKHAFTNPAADEKAETYGLPLGYDEAADRQSWAELKEFLARVFS